MFQLLAQAKPADQDQLVQQILLFLYSVVTNPVSMGILFALAVASVSVVTTYRYKLRKTEIEASLKHEMLQRGMSAQEIERVLAAGIDPRSGGADVVGKEAATCAKPTQN